MTSPFRSTANLAARRRQRPVIERATFVIVSLGTWRVGVPVESVERVLRTTTEALREADGVRYGERLVPWAPVRFTRAEPTSGDSTSRRVLIVHDRGLGDRWWALKVEAVHEVYAIETALVLPAAPAEARAPRHPAVRGMFDRHDHRVYVIDPVRLLSESV